MKKSIQQRRDEYNIAKAMLLGCEFMQRVEGDWHFRPCTTGPGEDYLWSAMCNTQGDAARRYLKRIGEDDLEGWCGDEHGDNA